MLEEERELLARAESIVRKALSAISEDLEAEQIEEEEEEEEGEEEDDGDLSLDDITMENDEDPHATTRDKSIAETAVTLTEAVITAVSVSNEEEGSAQDTLSVSDEPEGLVPDQDSGSFISLHSTHSLKIPSAEPVEEEEDEEEVAERVQETRAEFVVRKNFENFTEYARRLNGKDRLSEKRFLQMLRELGLIGPGKKVNTTDAEIVYFKHAKQRTKGLTLPEFKESLGVILELNNRDEDSISEEVLYPAVPVHHYRTVFMSIK